MASKSQKARDKAREYFGLGAGDDDFVLHHVDPTLKKRDPERYKQWNPEDLCIMSRAEHASLHHKCKNLSEVHKKRIREANRGKKHSEKTRKKMSESNKSKKPVEQYTLAGELVRVWESAKAAEVEGFNQGNIARVCRGKQKHHKKYIWKYSQ